MRKDATKLQGKFKVQCFGPDGKLKWEDEFENLVVNAGLDYFLDVGLLSGTQITSWYVGLTDGTPSVAAGDTMSSHSGWSEVTAYSETARPAYSGSRSGQTVSNSSQRFHQRWDKRHIACGWSLYRRRQVIAER